jgi:hypothetical protein
MPKAKREFESEANDTAHGQSRHSHLLLPLYVGPKSSVIATETPLSQQEDTLKVKTPICKEE